VFGDGASMVYGVWCMVYGLWSMVYGCRTELARESKR